MVGCYDNETTLSMNLRPPARRLARALPPDRTIVDNLVRVDVMMSVLSRCYGFSFSRSASMIESLYISS